MDTWSTWKKQTQFKANSKPIQTQFKANSKPIQTQTKPIYHGVASMSWICCVCSFSISFDSAKMAQYMDNWNLKKDGRKKFNFLKYKRLNNRAPLSPPTGTPFAYLNRWNFPYTDYTQ